MDAKAQASFDALDETLVKTREEREAAYRKIGELKDALRLLDKAQVVHLQPDDVLLIGNIGDIDIDTDTEQAQSVVDDLKASLNVKKVFMFSEGIDIDLIRDLAPCPYCSRPEGWDACPVHRDGQPTTAKA